MSKEYMVFKHEQLKVFMKEGRSKYYCIGFSKTEEKEIVSNVTEYTGNCVLLESKYEVNLRNVQMLYCDVENIRDVLEHIFEGKSLPEPMKHKEDIGVDGVEYMLFAKVNVFPSSVRIDERTKSNKFVDDYLFYTYAAMLEKCYKAVDILMYEKLGESCALLRFVDIDNTEEYVFEHLVVTLWAGLGDFFMLHSLQHEYLLRKKQDYENIYVPVVKHPYTNKNIKMIHGDNVRNLVFDNHKMCGYFVNKFTHKIVICRDTALTWKVRHICDIWVKGLGTPAGIHPYEYDYVLKEKVMRDLAPEEKEMIDSMLGEKKYIGLQVFSGSFEVDLNVWRTREVRNWDGENAEKFLELCSENGMNVIVLTPHPYECLTKYMHLPQVSVSGYIYAVSKLRLVVGIDSSAGHIASFYDIPSVTLWGGTTPLSTEAEVGSEVEDNIGFRALRNNISIVSRSRSMKGISYQMVYDVVADTLTDGIPNHDKIISYDDSANDFNIIYTG